MLENGLLAAARRIGRVDVPPSRHGLVDLVGIRCVRTILRQIVAIATADFAATRFSADEAFAREPAAVC